MRAPRASIAGVVERVRLRAGLGIITTVAVLATLMSLATAFVAAPAGAVRTPGEIVRYDFTEGSGSTVTDSGSGAPLNLTIGNTNNVTWVPGGGLSVDASTVLSSGVAATKVYTAVQATNEMTVEAWIDPANNTQGGPARIVSSEGSSTARNFMVGQGAWSNLPDDTYAVRFRTTASLKGEPTLFTPAGTATANLTHVVMTRNAAGLITTYVDGVVEATQTRTGDLSNWASSYPLTVANLGNASRPWIGTLCQVAIYDAALTPGQVTDNFNAGCVVGSNADPVLDPIVDQSNAEGDIVSVPVTASDADPGDVLTFSATGLPDGVTIDSATGTMSGTITQTAATGSPYSVEVTVDDGRGGVVSTTFTWTVTAVNVDPVLDPIGNLLSGLGQTISLTVTATDADNDPLTFGAAGLPDGLTINTATGEITGTTTATGTFPVTVTVDDLNGGTDSETFDWIVVGNDDPVLDPIGAQSDSEGDTISLPVTATDPNAGDVLTFGATGLPDGLTIDTATGAITGTVTQTAATGSPYSTTVTVDDGVGGTDAETFQWDITAVNVAPQGTNPGTQTDNEGDVVSLTIAATDADNDTLTFGATGLPTGLSIDTATGAITGTIAAGAATGSPYSVEITVDDGNTGTDTQTISWTVGVITGPSPVVRYDFTEGSGTTVTDSAGGTPLNLTIADPGSVTWIPGGGLSVDASTVLSSGVAATKVFTAVQATNAMTVEAWVRPANNTQSGPARIVSSAEDPFARNFMLGQGAYSNLPDDTYAVRFRTSDSTSGTPELFTPAGTATTALTHVVMTRTAAGNITTYVDGVAQATQTRTGDLSNWDLSYPLTVANLGNGTRPWIGALCQVAIYDQALTPTEVGDNYTAGCDLPAPPASALVQVTPNGGIGATTFGNATITATNTSPTPRSIRSAPPATRAPSASPSAAKAAPDSSCPPTSAPIHSPCPTRTPPESSATAGTA